MSPAQWAAHRPLITDSREEWRRPGRAPHRPPHSGLQRWDGARRRVSTARSFRPNGKGTEGQDLRPQPSPTESESAFAPGAPRVLVHASVTSTALEQ